MHNLASCFCIVELDKNSDRMLTRRAKRAGASDENRETVRHKKVSARDRILRRRCTCTRRKTMMEEGKSGGEGGRRRRKGCNLAPIRLPARIRKRRDRQVQPYVVGDNDRSRDSISRFLPSSRATSSLFGPRRKRYRISSVYLGMRERAARVTLYVGHARRMGEFARATRSAWKKGGKEGGRERHVLYYACVPQGWSKTDLRRSGRISTDGNELHIRPLREQIPWASSRKRGENRKSRINFLDIRDPIFSLYMKIICNIRYVHFL